MQDTEIKRLKKLSASIRLDTLKMLKNIGYGHLGGALSIVELLSVLYGKHLKYDANNPQWEHRDMLVLSKGHAGPSLYSALANAGFFDKEILSALNKGGANLPSHPDRMKTPGIDMTTGSLGQGTSAAAGIAAGFRMKKSSQTVYLIVGDGELNEGQCWEAFQYIAHNKLSRCIVIIDNNKRQLDGFTHEIIDPFCIKDKMTAFGFTSFEVRGDDEEAISEAIDKCKSIKDKAVCIVLDTVKGQGIPYFEEMKDNHSVKFNNDDVIKAADEAIKELEAFVKEGS